MYELRDWWYSIAQTLPVGVSKRVAHPMEPRSRPSVVIRNSGTEYSAWDFRRNAGDRVPKEHTIPSAPTGSEQTDLPKDITPVLGLTQPRREEIERFLVSKGVTSRMFTEGSLHYSHTRKRLIWKRNNIWLGRDLTGRSSIKWVDYTPQITNRYESATVGYDPTTLVLVEDILSAHKVHWATGYTSTAVLGTRVRDIHCLEVLRYTRVLVSLDGDLAGRSGSYKMLRDLRAMDINVELAAVPTGLDPKDLTANQLRDLYGFNTD